jgi:hypothetical protein
VDRGSLRRPWRVANELVAPVANRRGPRKVLGVQFAWKFGVIALIALGLVVLPGGGGALDVVLTLLTVAFFAAIVALVYRFYRQYRIDLETLSDMLRLVLYGSIGLALLTFTATDRLFNAGGAGVLVWFALLALASYGLFFVWTRYRRYS